jgi:poly(A) polymerase
MNALYCTHAGRVIDPLGGLSDLERRHVRFVGDPAARITEDYLRILRFFRFHAWYGDESAGLDAEGLAACAAHIEGLATLSCERIGAEMRKLLSAPNPAPSVAAMAHCGALLQVLPGSDARALPILVHIEGAMSPEWLRRLAVLGGQDQTEVLRLSRTESAQLQTMLAAIGTLDPPAALGFRHGVALAADITLARAALLESHLPTGWQSEIARGAAAVFPVAAADLMPNLQGAALGARLRDLQNRWISSDFRLTRAELLR